MSENDTFYCSFVSIHYIICECGETFPTEEALRGHLDKEHPHKKERKEYKCGVCQKIYSTESACIDHYEESHLDLKDYKDEGDEDECQDANSIVEAELQEYEKPLIPKKKPQYYSNERMIVCEICGRRYASTAALRYHQRVHTGERPYACTMCPKAFTMPLFLQIHIRTHTGERPYQCQLCPKAFSNKAALLRHDRVHTGAKPYGCPQCGKCFTQSNSMKLHVNTVHLKMPAPYKSKNRKQKARERELLRKSMYKVIDKGEVVRMNSLQDGMDPDLGLVKDEVQMYEEVAESEILYDNEIDDKEVTYEVVYQD